MSHEVESLFYVDQVPWHGLGVKLDDPPTIREAIVAAGLDWTVSTHPLYYKVVADDFKSKLLPTPNCAVVRDTDSQYLGTVGKNWTPLQNIEAFEFFQPFLDEGLVTLDTAGSLRNGKHIWVLARIKGDPLTIVGDDTIERYILLANGHDGTMAATGAFTPIRTVCANTLAAALENDDTKMMRVVHTKKIKENLDLVQMTMDAANSQFVADAELYRELASRQINQSDLELFVQRVFLSPRKLKLLQKKLAEAGIKELPGQRLIDTITPLFEKGRGNDLPGVKGTWWAAYNSVTEYLSHERGQSDGVRLDSLWFGQNAVTNQRALNTAKEMAFV